MNIVVLAAGLGKRMASPLPKLLHPLGGKPMLGHLLATIRAVSPEQIMVVVGHGADRLRAAFEASDIAWVEQAEQLGTGHAVMQAVNQLGPSPVTLILNGDVPLVRAETLTRLAAAAQGDRLALLTVQMPDASGYGRVVRSVDGAVLAIVEHKDATPEEKHIKEINTGMMAVPTTRLEGWLKRLRSDNAQGEYYLTDIFAMAAADGVDIVTAAPDALIETMGVNSQGQLTDLERLYQKSLAQKQLDAGVMMADANRFEQRGELSCGVEVRIDIDCIFEGVVKLGDRVRIGAHCILKNVEVAADVEIAPFCHIDGATIGSHARIGPYARLRPGTTLASDVHVGNFVEVKNSQLGAATKANHLSYLGDASIGSRVNVGAGTITCNYDGVNKHRTVIEDDVQIGSDVQLVAPVIVGAGSTIGAGTTVWKDVAKEELVVNPKSQTGKAGWRRPKKL